MKTTKANATNNFLGRVWSHKHYSEKLTQKSNMYRGTITETTTRIIKHFHTAGEFLDRLEGMYKNAERRR